MNSNESNDQIELQNRLQLKDTEAIEECEEPSVNVRSVTDPTLPDVEVKTVGKIFMFKGLLLAALAGFIISLNSLVIKSLYSVNAADLTLFRYVSSIIYSLPFIFYNNVKTELKSFALILAARSLVSVGCIYLRIISNQRLVLTDSNVIAISTPVFVAVFGRILLKEKMNRAATIALGFTVVGVAVVSQFWTFGGESNQDVVLGTVAALASIVLAAISLVLVRKMSISGVEASAIVFHHGWMSGFISIGLAAATDGFELLNCEWKMMLSSYQRLVFLGMGTFTCQMLLNTASQFEKATIVALVNCSVQITCVFVWQFVFFDKVPSFFSYTGAVLVLVGSFTLYFAIWIKTWNEKSYWKKLLVCLTE